MAVVGAGILGLAHAYFAAKRARSVVVFERTPRAQGASVRNFGMIWPIGQRAGAVHQMATRSRQIWNEILDAAGLQYRPTGSLHVVYHHDEADVAREFVERAPGLGYTCNWLSPAEVLKKSQAVNPEKLLGGIWSPTELTVDPRLILARLPSYLTEKFGVQFRFGTAVRSIELPRVEAGSEIWDAEHAVVCGGDDFETLFPELFARSRIDRCKLQMMRTAPQKNGWELALPSPPGSRCASILRLKSARRRCRNTRRGSRASWPTTIASPFTLSSRRPRMAR